MSRLRRVAVTVLAAVALATAPGGSASASPFKDGPSSPPPVADGPQRRTVTPTPVRTCQVYASSSGFGLLCSDAGAGQTLAVQAGLAGIDTSRPFCWDDPDLPDGFDPQGQGAQPDGPGRWWLHTCLSFDGGVVVKDRARLSYEYRFLAPGVEDELNAAEQAFVTRVTGRGQIPYLQVQTSPVSSPRVEQDVAFSMLCSPKVTCRDTPQGRRITTPELRVGGVVMHAELVHLRVLPEGPGRPDITVDCEGAGLPQTAQELDRGAMNDPQVCRYSYARSSDGAGAGSRGDRYPAQVTAYWQVFVDDGSGPVPFRDTYAKTSTNLIRVTEVQTLVVS